MKLVWSSKAWDDYSVYWCHAQQRKLKRRLDDLIRECMRTPHEGTGKPEPLKHELSGWWSRRITDEHRLVYRVIDDLEILSCRYHYNRQPPGHPTSFHPQCGKNSTASDTRSHPT